MIMVISVFSFTVYIKFYTPYSFNIRTFLRSFSAVIPFFLFFQLEKEKKSDHISSRQEFFPSWIGGAKEILTVIKMHHVLCTS